MSWEPWSMPTAWSRNAMSRRLPTDSSSRGHGGPGGSPEDPYSHYLSPENYEKLKIQVTGTFGGIGVIMTLWEGDIVIVDPPMPGSPAAAAGLQAGDIITSVDGRPLAGLTVDQAAELIRGPVGTEVDLGIRRGEELLEVTLVREHSHYLGPVPDAGGGVGIGYPDQPSMSTPARRSGGPGSSGKRGCTGSGFRPEAKSRGNPQGRRGGGRSLPARRGASPPRSGAGRGGAVHHHL